MKKYFPHDSDSSLEKFTEEYSKRLNDALKNIDSNAMRLVLETFLNSIKNSNTIYSCGNGGSSSIADHLVCDFVKGAANDSSIDPKVVPLLSTPMLTAIANDISYDEVFAFQIKQYANKGDILLSISSSGNSENIIRAIEQAKSMGVITISFVGFNGGRAKEISDLCLHISSNNYGICEDAHHALMHIFAQYLRVISIDDKKKIGSIAF
tara:strand:+ start:499 stop:1125 length:627 start_codon:yes stop_codon:yes gene_type:complete